VDIKNLLSGLKSSGASKPGLFKGLLVPVALMSTYLAGKKLMPTADDIALEKIQQRGEMFKPLSATPYLPSKLHQSRIFENMFQRKV
jgi:hypothetical protein